MSHGDPAKWYMPGWRIEQRYSPGVLLGNWGEDQHSFHKGAHSHNSTYRKDYQKEGSWRPDVIIRRKAQLQNAGLGKEFLFYHHGNSYSNNMISWYDEHFNKRERDEQNKLPELRSWDSNRLSWVPEKTDFPIQGAPTNFGLSAKRNQRWIEQVADATTGDFNTTYRASFTPHTRHSLTQTRHATPREKSTTLLRQNSTNKDLQLRGKLELQSPQVTSTSASVIAF